MNYELKIGTMGISENLQAVRSTLPEGVDLVAVSKFHPMEKLLEAYAAGQRIFGESRVQELAAKIGFLTKGQTGLLTGEQTCLLTGEQEKQESSAGEFLTGEQEKQESSIDPSCSKNSNLSSCFSCSPVEKNTCSPVGKKSPVDWRWHFIGHLQTNKVRQLLRLRPTLIESVDSEHLLAAIDREAAVQGVIQPVLMQLHVAQEETKTGFLPEELLDYFRNRRFEQLKAVHICGVMGMASNTDDRTRIEADFRKIRSVFDEILRLAPDLRGFSTVSMGMSDDYPLAVSCGSTLVRVGSAIFGPREY